jgi:hypothetical protein
MISFQGNQKNLSKGAACAIQPWLDFNWPFKAVFSFKPRRFFTTLVFMRFSVTRIVQLSREGGNYSINATFK